MNADISDGIWVQNEPFTVGADGLLEPVHSPVTDYPENSNFSAGLRSWKILKHGDIPQRFRNIASTASTNSSRFTEGGGSPQPLCWYNATFGPHPGLGSAMCEFTGATPAAPHSLTMGIQSSMFPMDQGGIYAWSAWVWTEADMHSASGASAMQFSVIEVGSTSALPPLDYHRGSGQPMGRRSVGAWAQLSGTLLGSSAGNGSGYVLGWLDGNVTGKFAIADIQILRLNSALVNVVRTAASDINVSSEDGSIHYQAGRDFVIQNAPLPNKAEGEDLVAAFASNNTYKVRRLLGGRLEPGQRVRLSLDVLGGLVGQVGDGAHLNSFAEPLYFEWMQKVIQFTMRTLGCKRLMFGFDEMHGFNRDSRSRALGRSNAETLAYTINTLQSFMHEEDPESRAMVWADMLCPFHNGGRPHYQQYSGGIEGATWHAAAMLDKKVIVVPWWYGGYDTAPVENCSKPNIGKGCTDPGTDCGNVRCAMDNQPGYWRARGMDWLAGGGTKADNLAKWSSLQKGYSNALGVMTTQWSSPPDTTGIPYAGEYGWNQAHSQRTKGCAAAQNPSLAQPLITSVTVFNHSTKTPGDFFPCIRIPSGLWVPAGAGGTDGEVLLAFAECRRWVGDGCYPDGVPHTPPSTVEETDRYVCMRRSTDGGKSFGPVQTNITGRRSTNPTAVWLGQTATVLLFFNAPSSNLSDYRAYVMESSDRGLSFGTPRMVFDPNKEKTFAHVPTIVGPGNGAVVLPSGAPGGGPRLVLSLYSHLKPPRLSPLPATSFLVGVVYSDTRGRTWKASAASIPYLGEPQLAGLASIGPRSVMLNGRCADRSVYNHNAYHSPCAAGYRGVALSTDGGVTFGPTEYDRQLQSPNCQGASVSSDGVLYYSGADSRETRMNMSVWSAQNVSEWPPKFSEPTLLSPKQYAAACSSKSKAPCGAAYSGLFAAHTGGVGVLWERGTDGCNGASCAIVLSWVR